MASPPIEHGSWLWELRLRRATAGFTFKEVETLTNHETCTPERVSVLQSFSASASDHTELVAWYNDLLSDGHFEQGKILEEASPLWSVCKAIMLCERQVAVRVGTRHPVGCYCVSKAYFFPLGCAHSDEVANPDDEPVTTDMSCSMCNTCLRCHGQPS